MSSSLPTRRLGALGPEITVVGFGAWAIGGNRYGNSYGPTNDAESIRAFGLDVVTGLCRRLIDGGAPGIHFYTLNQSTLSLEICRRLAG